MKTGILGIGLIKSFESLALKAYRCPAGVLTIGYGHTSADVVDGLVINSRQADALLALDLRVAENAVNAQKLLLTQHQFDALVSFTYNCGVGNFQKSTLLKMIRVNPNSANIGFEFSRWNKGGGQVLSGLIRRRKAEFELYNTKQL
jgi:lysozyme